MDLYSLIQHFKQEIQEGKFINLRIAKESDAEFILNLRLNPFLNKYLSKTDPSIEKQKTWINQTYLKDNDFMFVIEDKNSIQYGTIALYDIDYNKGRAEWGRLVLKQNSLFTFPIEATIQLLNFAFHKLGLKELYGGANNENKAVLEYHKQYADITSEDDKYTWFSFDEKSLIKLKRKYKNFHNL